MQAITENPCSRGALLHKDFPQGDLLPLFFISVAPYFCVKKGKMNMTVPWAGGNYISLPIGKVKNFPNGPLMFLPEIFEN